jgi:metal-responsive CopG/Arc/MetJ family transcriptional regulator
MNQVKVLITMEKETRNEFKSLAAKDGESMTEVINNLIARYIQRKNNTHKQAKE